MNKILNKLWESKARAKKKGNKGFTLIELVVVIAIIAVLVALIAPNLIGYLGQAKSTKGNAAAKSVYTAIVAYSATNDDITAENIDVDLIKTGGASSYFNQQEIDGITAVSGTVNGSTVTSVTVTIDDVAYTYPEETAEP